MIHKKSERGKLMSLYDMHFKNSIQHYKRMETQLSKSMYTTIQLNNPTSTIKKIIQFRTTESITKPSSETNLSKTGQHEITEIELEKI